jgi:hypothetical protein
MTANPEVVAAYATLLYCLAPFIVAALVIWAIKEYYE